MIFGRTENVERGGESLQEGGGHIWDFFLFKNLSRSGGVLTVHCYFLTNTDNLKPSTNGV